MAETTVIHVRDMNQCDRNDVYIGRAVPRRGFKASPWANPFPIGEEHNRASVLSFFENWVRTSGDLRAVWIRKNLENLRGKRLACWCAPSACHGDVLLKILAERDSDPSHADLPFSELPPDETEEGAPQ